MPLLFLIALCTLAWAGCDYVESYDSTLTPPLPGFSEAQRIVWNVTYGRTDEPPQINWVYKMDCHCGQWVDGQPSFCSGFSKPLNQGCVGGTTTHDGRIYVAADHQFPYSTLSLAHEMFHYFLLVTTGDLDNDHKNPGFAPGGIVEEANARLLAAGL